MGLEKSECKLCVSGCFFFSIVILVCEYIYVFKVGFVDWVIRIL